MPSAHNEYCHLKLPQLALLRWILSAAPQLALLRTDWTHVMESDSVFGDGHFTDAPLRNLRHLYLYYPCEYGKYRSFTHFLRLALQKLAFAVCSFVEFVQRVQNTQL